jgi:hypothetical protein
LESGLLALIDRAGDLNIYDPKLPNPLLHTWPFKGSVQRMISGPLPNTLLTVTDSEVIELDFQSGTRRWTLPLEGLRIQDMVLCPKKEQLALAFTDGTVQVATLDVMRSARARKIRPLTSDELSRFQLGTPEEIEAARSSEESIARGLLREAITSIANSSPLPTTLAWCADRILSPVDPIPEMFREALNYCVLALRQTRRPDVEMFVLLARAHIAVEQWAPATEALDRAEGLIGLTEPQKERVERLRIAIKNSTNPSGAHPI